METMLFRYDIAQDARLFRQTTPVQQRIEDGLHQQPYSCGYTRFFVSLELEAVCHFKLTR